MCRVRSYLERHIEPSEWWGALLFGLIMAMIFTVGGRSVVAEGEDATHDMLVGVIGCNVAWGIIQGWMFVLEAVFERTRLAHLLKEVKESTDEEQALAAIRDELDPTLEMVASDEERARLYAHILGNVKKADQPKTGIKRDDLITATIIFVLISLTALPAVLPFLLMDNLRDALRVANSLQVLLLFLVGFGWANATHANRWVSGLGVMFVGILMAVVGELLGG